MADPGDDTTRRPIPVGVILGVVVALIVLLVVVVAILFAKYEVDGWNEEPGQDDLLQSDNASRLPDVFVPLADDAGALAIEAEVYVPVYSTVYAGQKTVHSNLAATLSIRNTSQTASIVVRGVRYFDTEGDMVSQFIDRPHSLGPMATADFFVDAADVRGGTGANFIVDWAADTAVSEPVIEAVMIGSIGARGISFISRGIRVGPTPTSTDPVQDRVAP